MRRFFAPFLLLTLAPGLAWADAKTDAARALAAHQRAEQTARQRLHEDSAQAEKLAAQQVAAAASLRRLEVQTSQATEQLAQLQTAQTAAGAKLHDAEAGLATLLPVMQRLSAQPAATMLATPQSPSDAVRGIAIIQGIAAAIAAQALDVQTQSRQVTALIAQTQDAQTQLNAAVTTQQNAENALNDQIAAAKSAELADSDTTIREAAAGLAAQRKLQTINAAIARLAAAKTAAPVRLKAGAGGAPVAGAVQVAYGASTAAGPATGISYAAAAGARVITPCNGTVMFAGPLPSYDQVVIADCGGGNSVVLAGMNHLDVATGQHLAHGQPVGSMLSYDKSDPTRQPVLYVELRRNGAAVNPTAWLAGGGSG